jgi:molybdopterin/thiamine biosynthesis adenylyltransferase
MNDQQLMRYARHILLDEFGIEGQERLLASRVLIVGAGGLGSPAAAYLASAGVGHLVLADDDEVDVSNLQRQILHATARVGWPKADSGKHMLEGINPDIRIDSLVARLEGHALDEQVAQADLVLDCCDNFATRHAVNRACVKARKVSVYDLRRDDAPCYHCLFPEHEGARELYCATTGVLGPLVGIIGSVQAAEAIKLLAGMGEPLVGRLLCLDALAMQWQSLDFSRDPACTVCAGRSVPPAVSRSH